jgi:prolyl-tRNA synthetase
MASPNKKTAVSPTRAEDYPEWYQQVVIAADLAENSPVRGCMVIKPWGYAIWERMQAYLDRRFRETGHENAYFPLLIPVSFLEKEAKHVEGFAKECAVVTHHRLEAGPDGKLIPAGKLEEPYVIRPTSETIIGAMFAKWSQTYRDLPILINQWANIVRWEMRTRLFLRTTEFLWQEGHTAHATAEEAMAETKKMLEVYAEFAERVMAMPVIPGEKTATERFPGAVHTYCIEAMMQDGKALQAGTSHFLGQNFAKAQEIRFTNAAGELEHAWTTSWGVSTRLIGGLIMTHSDDDGLVLPPWLAPMQVVILPVIHDEAARDKVLEYCRKLAQDLGNKEYAGERVRVTVDEKDARSADKMWSHVKRGVPVRLEIGPREVDAGTVSMSRRDEPVKDRKSLARDEAVAGIPAVLEEIQANLLARARTYRAAKTRSAVTLDEFKALFSGEETGFVSCFAADSADYLDVLEPLKVTPRCIPLEGNDETGKCIFTGRAGCRRIIFAKSY